ncbi:hypothetical protein D9M72_624870 [compost metagenome]
MNREGASRGANALSAMGSHRHPSRKIGVRIQFFTVIYRCKGSARFVDAQALVDNAVFRRRFRIRPMRPQALQIALSEAGPALTPPLKRFNTLIRQI